MARTKQRDTKSGVAKRSRTFDKRNGFKNPKIPRYNKRTLSDES